MGCKLVLRNCLTALIGVCGIHVIRLNAVGAMPWDKGSSWHDMQTVQAQIKQCMHIQSDQYLCCLLTKSLDTVEYLGV